MFVIFRSTRIKRLATLVTMLLMTVAPKAQTDETANAAEKNSSNFVTKTIDFIAWVLSDTDTAFVAPNKYNFAFYPEYSHRYEHYRFATGDGKQSISIAPQHRDKLGLNIGWRWLVLGYSIDLQDSRPAMDFNTSVYSARFGLDLFYRENSGNYSIRKLSGFNNNGKELTNFNKEFEGLSTKQIGFNVCYAFNKRFTHQAAYAQSSNQLISAGSFILGMNYNYQQFTFDHKEFDTKIQQLLSPRLKFEDISYHDFSLNFGYTYNWVFAKNFLANISFTPAVGYKHSSLKLPDSNNLLSSINFDFITRAAVVYNTGKYFAGASLVAHTYTYKKPQISIINGFGVIEVYAGFNFWRRK